MPEATIEKNINLKIKRSLGLCLSIESQQFILTVRSPEDEYAYYKVSTQSSTNNEQTSLF
jgi:hypothetical protein